MSPLLVAIYGPALASADPVEALRRVVIQRLKTMRRGHVRAELREWLDAARDAGDDAREDALLTVVAQLAGWCPPWDSLEHVGWLDDAESEAELEMVAV
jgi:hypothetical protein